MKRTPSVSCRLSFYFCLLAALGRAVAASASLPPTSGVTFPSNNAFTPSLMSVSGTAAADVGRAVMQVQVTIQRPDGQYFTGSSWTGAQTFLTALGTGTWTLNSSTAIHVSTGLFTIVARATDDVAQVGYSTITVTRKLNDVTGLTVTARSSSTFTLSWNENGNPPGTQYHIHLATGDCSTSNFNAGTQIQSPPGIGIPRVVGGLQPNTPYTFHVHIHDANGSDQSNGGPGAPGSPNANATTRDAFLADESNPSFNTCNSGSGGSFSGNGGQAIAVAPTGTVWEVFGNNGVYNVVKFSSAGVFLSSAALPGATDNGGFAIAATQNDTYVVGSSTGAAGDANVAFWRFSALGAPVSSATYNSPFNKNEYAVAVSSIVDSSGNVWITGVVQMSGPIDESPGARTYGLGIWKFDPTVNLLTNTTIYASGNGMDGGWGAAIELGSGSTDYLWIVGYSSNPANLGPSKLDLALWKYDLAVSTFPSPYPLRLPAYAADPDRISAALLNFGPPTNRQFVAAARLNSSGNFDLGVAKFNTTATDFTADWHSSAPPSDDVPHAAALDPVSGKIVVAGGFGPELAVWKYDQNGVLFTTETVVGQGIAQGVAVAANGDIWLATQSTAPFKFTGGTPISGALGLQPAATPPTSAITTPSNNAVVADLSSVFGTAADDAAVAEVRVSIQRQRDGLYWNGSAFAAGQTFLPASGANNWSFFTDPGVNDISTDPNVISTGAFTIVSRAQDTSSTLQTAFGVGVSSLTVIRRPNMPGGLTLPFVGSSSATISWSPSGNPPNQTYHIHYQTATSCNDITPFLASNYLAGSSQTLTGLQSGVTYFFTIHTMNAGVTNNFLFQTFPGGQSGTFRPLTDCGGGGGGPGGGGDFGGLAAGFDPSGNLWEVISENGQFRLAKFTSGGVFVSSTALIGATDRGEWSLAFSSGDAFAVGSSSASVGSDIGVWRVSPSGVLVASATFNSSYNNNEFAVGVDTDSSGNVWIAGVIQTGGPADGNSNGSRTYALGLWKFSTANLLTNTTIQYSPDGMIGALDVQVSSSNRLWVVGVSSFSANPGTNKVDLILWRYDATGTTLDMGPFGRPAYVHSVDQEDMSARMTLAADGPVIAATRRNGAGNYDFGYVHFNNLGAIQAEKAWFSNGPAGDDVPRGVAQLADGTLIAAGQTPDPGPNGKRLAVWKYDAAGVFRSAETAAPFKSGRGVAVNPSNGDVWLAVDSTSPYKWLGGNPLPGQEGQEGTVNNGAGNATFLGDFSQPSGAVYDGGDKDGGDGTSIARDGSGNVYLVTISSRGANDYDWAIIKYDSQGHKVASTTVNSGAGLGDGVRDVMVSGSDLYVAGDSPNGQMKLIRFDANTMQSLASIGGSTGTYVGLLRGSGSDLFTSYVSGGSLKIEKRDAFSLALSTVAAIVMGTYSPARQKRNLATDGTNIFVAAFDSGLGFLVARYDSNLSILNSWGMAQEAYRSGGSIAYSSYANSIYVTAVATKPADETSIMKFDTSLTTVTIAKYQTSFVPSGELPVRSIAVENGSGHVFVVGNYGQPALRYDAALGLQGIGNHLQGMTSVVPENSQTAYVAGGANGGADVAVRKVDFGAFGTQVGVGFSGIAYVPDAGPTILWAASSKANKIGQYNYPPSPVTDFTSTTSGRDLQSPLFLSFDTQKNLWVSVSTSPSASGNSQLVRFSSAPGNAWSASTTAALSAGLYDVRGLAFQPDTGDLWATNGDGAPAGSASILKFLRGGSLAAPTFSNTNVSTFATVSQFAGGGVAFDAANNLWVAGKDGLIRMYSNSAGVIGSAPSLTIAALAAPSALAFNASGDLFASNADFKAAPGTGSLWKFRNLGTAAAPSISTTPVLLQTGVDLSGLAFDGSALWGADFNASQVLPLSTGALAAQQQTATINGAITYAGAKTGTYLVALSTDPVNIDTSFAGTRLLNLGGSPGSFSSTDLLAPNTYYVVSILDTNGNNKPDGFDPQGGYITGPAPRALAPIYLTPSLTVAGVNVQLLDMSAASGTITNLSAQLGNLRAQAWFGDPRVAGSALIADTFVSTGASSASYAVYVQTTTNLFTRAYVDANFNGKSDAGEDAGVSNGPWSTVALSTIPVNVTISSSAAGTVYVQATDLAPSAAGSNATDLPMLRLGLWTSGGSAQMTSLRASMSGDAPATFVHARVWKDANNDGVLQTGQDFVLNGLNFNDGAPPQINLPFFSTQTLTGTTQYFFLTFGYSGLNPGRKLGVYVERPSDVGLANGAVASSLTFPMASTNTVVRFTLFAKPADAGYPTPYPNPASGGAFAGLFINNGQTVVITATGTWSTGGFAPNNADGVPGQLGGLTGGLKLGSLVGRIGGGNWFQLGQNVVFTSTQTGDLYLAMNDSSYGDDSGALAVDFAIQASTVTRVWTGASGFNLNADIDSNWQNGRPVPGDGVKFDGSVSNANCNWNLYGSDLSAVTLTANYTGRVTIVGPSPTNSYNTITFSSHVTVNGGTLDLGDDTDALVKGELRVQGGTLDLGTRFNHLRLSKQGLVARSGGIVRSQGTDFVSIEAANPTDGFPFRVENATVSFGNAFRTELDNASGVDLTTAAVLGEFRNVSFFNWSYNPAPSLVIRSQGAINRTLRNVVFDLNVSTNVDASGVASGSSIQMLDASGARMGSPFEKDPNGVVSWSPDGGGAGQVSGSITYLGTLSNIRVRASTSPAIEGPALFDAPMSTGAYAVTLAAPNTYFFFAYRDANANLLPDPADPRGGYGNPGSRLSSAFFLPASGSVGSVDVTIKDLGTFQGNATNASSQVGVVRVRAIRTGSGVFEAETTLPSSGGPYTLFAPATTYSVVGWVDVNNNALQDGFEASGSSTILTAVAGSTKTGADFPIAGGSAPPGGTLSLAASGANPGYLGDFGPHAVHKFVLSASGGDATWNGLRVDASPTFPYGATVGIWKDAANLGTFDDPDFQVGSAFLPANVASGTIQLFQPQTVLSGQSATYYLTLDFGLSNGHPSLPQAGLTIGSTAYFSLGQGSMATQAIYPIASGPLPVYYIVLANTPAYVPSGGGFDTGIFAAGGQQVAVAIATGAWTPAPYGTTTPLGVAGTENQNTVRFGARVGQLIARVGGEPWVAVGTAATFTAQFGGNVGFAMNDLQNDYFNNSGKVYFNFAVSGSTVGAITGQVLYTGTAAGSSGKLMIRALQQPPFCHDCAGVPVSTAAVSLVNGTTAYAYTIGGLTPGFYSVGAFVDVAPTQTGGTFSGFPVNAGSTATAPTFAMSLGAGSIAGSIAYAGIQTFGSYFLGVTTSSNLQNDVVFFGTLSTPAAGAYTLSNLPTPNTYYIVGFRDVDANGKPSGPEPFGVHGTSTGPISNLGPFLTPIFVDTAAAVGGKNVTLLDRGAVNGQIGFQNPVSNMPVRIEVGHGTRGSANYALENQDDIFANVGPGGSLPYDVPLLRTATDYSVFAYVDSNFNRAYDAGEVFGQSAGLVSVTEGAVTPVSLSIGGPQAPPPPGRFSGVALDTANVSWSWDASPGAITYELRTSTGGLRYTLLGTTTVWTEVLASPGQLSLVDRITATNGQGTSAPTLAAGGAKATLALAPGTPTFNATGVDNTNFSWATSGNASSTTYEVHRATSGTAPFFVTLVSTYTPRTDFGLAPATAYTYKIRAINPNGLPSAFSGTASTTTPSASGPSIAGSVTYAGKQSGNLIVQASVSSVTFSPVAAQAVLPAGALQPYYLPVGAGTYYVRGFVDVYGDLALHAGADAGQFSGSIAVAGPQSGKDFTVAADTVAPASPAGVTASKSLGQVNLAWVAPTRNADGSSLVDLAGFRVQRSTPGASWVTLTTATVYGATGTVAASPWTDFAPVTGVDNYYRIVAVDFGANQSLPSGVLAVQPALGGTISGALEYLGSTTQGAFRLRLSTVAAVGSFVKETQLNPFSFTGLADGTYFVRGFRDLDSNGNQDDGEPAGTNGGISKPYALQVINGNTISGSTVTVCDRTTVLPGTSNSGSLATTDCRALDQGRSFYTDVFTFRVGGGAAGSVGVGSQVEIRMDSAFGNRLFLLGPDGNVLAQDQRPGGAYISYVASQPGLYKVEPTSFDPSVTGPYTLRFNIVGGFGGAIAGTVSYTGSQTGKVQVQLFNSLDSNAFPIRVSTFAAPGAYSVGGLPDGVYYVRAFRDSNANFVKDAGEAEGAYGASASSPTAVSIIGGVASAGPADIALADPAVGSVSGQILRDGSQSGVIRVEIGTRQCDGCDSLNVVRFATRTGAGSYALPFVPPATNYVLLSYVDVNGNQHADPLEAKAFQEPMTVQANQTTSASLLVRDPGLGNSGNATITGTVNYGGAATGTVYVAFANDPQFNTIAYILTLAVPGSFTKSGILGGTSYYIAAFIDSNNNGNPDDAQGEPVGVVGGGFDSQSPTYVSPTGSAVANLTLQDPPTGRLSGRVSYSGAAPGSLVVQAFRRSCATGSCGDFSSGRAVIVRSGPTEYDYAIGFLSAATDYNVIAFVDSNGNQNSDYGEPFAQFGQTACSGTGPCFGAPVAVSSGTGSFPTYGVNVTVQDAGGSGGGNFSNFGTLTGEVIYLGTQQGPIVVRVFDNASCSGTPLHTLTFPLAPGPGQVSWSKGGLALGTYCVDAFRDTGGTGVFNPTFNAYGSFGSATLTQSNSYRGLYGDPITDPGRGGSINAYTGSFAAPGGARFEGGATDLAFGVRADTITAGGPYLYVMGITKQNAGTVFSLVKYSSAGVFLASATLPTTNFPRILIAPDGSVYVGGSTGLNPSTSTIFAYNAALGLVRTVQLNDSDVISGLAWNNGYLYVSGPAVAGQVVRKVDPATWITVATGTYQFPGSMMNTNAGGLVAEPASGAVYTQVSSGFGQVGGLTALLKFGANLGAPAIVQDVTSLNGGTDAALALDRQNGWLYLLTAPQGGTTATIYKFNSGLGQLGSVSYAPVETHFGAGLNSLDVSTHGVFAALQSPSNGGDFLLLRYDSNLNLLSQRTFDGNNNTLEDGAASVAVLDSSNVYVAGTVNNGQNLDWATVRLNTNASGAQTGAGTVVVITSATATNAILGKIVYKTGGLATASSGTIRAVLLDASGAAVRFASAPFGGSASYVFNNLPSGQYLIQAFIDKNGNFLPDSDEPLAVSGARGIAYAAGSNLSRPDLPLCDRRPIAAGVEISTGITPNDCAPEDRGGAFEQLYTFAGVRGQAVTIDLTATGFYDGFLTLRGPDGALLTTDDESGGNGNPRIANYVLPQDGLYTIGASAFAPGVTGAYRLSLGGSAGSLGSINGTISYTGSQGGQILSGVFVSTGFSDNTLVQGLRLKGPGAYSFTNLRTGTTYYIGAFVDANYSGSPDAGEDGAVFGTDGVPAPIFLESGQTLSGVDYVIAGSTSAVPNTAGVTGVVSYGGAKTGTLRVEFWSNSSFQGQPVGLRSIPTGPGPYDITLPGGAPYYARAFLDLNGDFQLGADEPVGVYAPRGQGAEAVFLPASGTVPNISFAILDRGVVAVGGQTTASGEGAAAISSATAGAPFGASTALDAGTQSGALKINVVIGPSGVRKGGKVGFMVPPGWPFPNAAPGSAGVTVATAAQAGVVPVVNGTELALVADGLSPSAVLSVVGSTPLVAGATVQFTYAGLYIPCLSQTATFTVGSVQGTGSTATVLSPLPLLSGSPSVQVRSGNPRFVTTAQPYFSAVNGQVSDAQRLETRDSCGNLAAVSGPASAELRAKVYNYQNGQFSADPSLTFSSAATGVFASPSTINFSAGASSAAFYALATTSGSKSIELFFNLGAPTTFYAALTVLQSNSLSNVSVSTVAYQLGRTSATIVPNSDPTAPNQAYVNFDLSDAGQSWQVLVSSIPFKAGVDPTPLWQTWGYGQPSRGAIAWDGRYSPWINFGGRVPSGSYYVRVEVGGGVRDDSLRVDVFSPQLVGRVLDGGTTPPVPLSGVTVRAYGPFGGGSAQTDALGNVVIPGLSAGTYQLAFEKPDYLLGSGRATVDAAGRASTASAVTADIRVSTAAQGALSVLMFRAPTLFVVPSLDVSISTQSFDQWGQVTVFNSTSSASPRFFSSPIRLPAGATTFDDGGQWDSSVQQFVTKSFLRFNVAVDTYTVRALLPGFDPAQSSAFVSAGATTVNLPAFQRRLQMQGLVTLPSNPAGTVVSISVRPSTASVLASSGSVRDGFGSVFLPAAQLAATYTVGDLAPNATYFLRANAQGLAAVTTGPVFLGSADRSGVDFPAFANPLASNVIVGTVTVVGDTRNYPALGPGQPQLRVNVNAWSPSSPNSGFAQVAVATNAATSSSSFSVTGLTPGVPYQLYAFLDQRGGASFTTPGGFPRTVTISTSAGKNADGTLQFSFELASGTIKGTVLLPPGNTDFLNVTLYGQVSASARPEEIGHRFEERADLLPGFLCADGSAPAAGACPAGISSATFRVDNLETQTVDVEFLYNRTGASLKTRVSVVNGTSTAMTADLRGSTFAIAGAIVNQISNDLFNTNAKVLSNAPWIPLLDGQGAPVTLDPSGVAVSTASTARVLAIRQELAAFTTSFNPATDRVGFLTAAGTWTITNVTPGVYLVRTANLRNCATCEVSVPSVQTTIRVGTASVAGVNLTLTDGFDVSGTISLADGVQDARVFNVKVLNKRQEVVRSTTVYLGDVGTGLAANAVDYSFKNLPRGEFYTLAVKGTLFPIKYAGRPIKFPDPALSPTGLQASLTGQNVVMQRAAYLTGRLKDANTGELITKDNATLLPPNLQLAAKANPWVEGGYVVAAASTSGRPILADGTFQVGPLIPDVNYDFSIQQDRWDLGFLSQGSQNYAPVLIGGQKPGPGEIRDLGTIGLNQGSALKGTVKDSSGTALGNIQVLAKPTFGGSNVQVQTFTDPNGAYTLWVSTFISSQFDVTAAPRGGNTASNGKVYDAQTRAALNLLAGTTADFTLRELLGSVTGQIATADGGELSYPFGDQKGFPAAAVFLQPRGVPPSNNPLGDLEVHTDEKGLFSVPGIATGTYQVRAISLGYVVKEATVTVTVSTSAGASFCLYTGATPTGCLQTLTLTRGAIVTGRILKPDPTSPSGFAAPNGDEVELVAAATNNFGKFVIGSVELDPNARTVNAYTISGFEPGLVYDLIIVPKGSDDVSFPPEGNDLTFTASESTTTKTINLTFSPKAPTCLGTQKSLGNNQFQIKIACTKPLRNQVASDSDLSLLLTVSTSTSKGLALSGIAPAGVNGTGAMLGGDKKISDNRREITAIYRAVSTETQFSLRLKGYSQTVDPTTGREFAIDQVFDFFTGLAAKKEEDIANSKGGKVQLEASDEDLALGKNERSNVAIDAGTFDDGTGNDLGALNVKVGFQKANDVNSASAKYLSTYGYVPTAVYNANNPNATPSSLYNAMQAYHTMASTGVHAASAFYDIFLPLGIRTQLKKPALLTFSYDLSGSTVSVDQLNVYFYNPATRRFELENTGRTLDTTNQTISVQVSHFSTFVVLTQPPTFTFTGFTGSDITAFNFPNPFDCIAHNLSTDPGVGVGNATVNGTLMHLGLPAGSSQGLSVNIYDTAGELVKVIDSGSVAGGSHVYVNWDCKNGGGHTVASGVYFGQVRWGGKSKFFKMAVIKGSGL